MPGVQLHKDLIDRDLDLVGSVVREDTCANYLLKYRQYLAYDRYLAAGAGTDPRY